MKYKIMDSKDIPMSKLYFTKNSKYNDLIGEFSGLQPGQCIEIECNSRKEKDNCYQGLINRKRNLVIPGMKIISRGLTIYLEKLGYNPESKTDGLFK